jgi:hypothetical protein
LIKTTFHSRGEKMKFTGSITHYYKDAPKEYLGIVRATDKIGTNNPLELGKYLYVLVKDATEFALECGISTEEANKELDQLREYLKNVIIKEH